MNLEFLNKQWFWYSFVLFVIISLFIYGLQLDYEKTTLQLTKEELKVSLDSIITLNQDIKDKNSVIKTLNEQNQNSKSEIYDLKLKVTELENEPPDTIIEYKYIDKIIYKEPYKHYPYGKGKGKLSIHKTCSNCPKFKVWVDNEYQGVLNSYFENGSPNCGQSGTISLTLTAGFHVIKCEDSYGATWDKDVVIVENECYKQGFRKN